jgi:hypothetical protein
LRRRPESDPLGVIPAEAGIHSLAAVAVNVSTLVIAAKAGIHFAFAVLCSLALPRKPTHVV